MKLIHKGRLHYIETVLEVKEEKEIVEKIVAHMKSLEGCTRFKIFTLIH